MCVFDPRLTSFSGTYRVGAQRYVQILRNSRGSGSLPYVDLMLRCIPHSLGRIFNARVLH